MAIFRWPGSWEPLAGLRYMQREMDRLFGRNLFSQLRRLGGESYPPVNVYSGANDIVVQCELAGVAKKDLELSITGQTLVIKGHKTLARDYDKRRYQCQERGMGEFTRTIVLPDHVDAERIDARMESGVLTINIPKSESAKPKQIQVK